MLPLPVVPVAVAVVLPVLRLLLPVAAAAFVCRPLGGCFRRIILASPVLKGTLENPHSSLLPFVRPAFDLVTYGYSPRFGPVVDL